VTLRLFCDGSQSVGNPDWWKSRSLYSKAVW